MTGKIKKEIPIILLFGVFFVLILLQFLNVGIYYDDYGYYSLTYGIKSLHTGHSFTFAELFPYLGEHYMKANGRISYYLLWLGLYRIGGFVLVRAGAAIILTGVIVLLYKLLVSKNSGILPRVITAVSLCSGFFIIPLRIHRHGTYWFAAFFHYYTPIIFLILFSIIYSAEQDSKKALRVFLCAIFVFFASWSVESYSVSCTLVCGLLFLWKTFRDKKFALPEIIYTAASAAGTLLLLRSPGILNRGTEAAGDADLIHRVKTSLAGICYIFYADYMRPYLIVLMCAAVVMAVSLFMKHKKFYDMICVTVCVLGIIVEIIKPNLLVNLVSRSIIGIAVCMVIFCATVFPALRYYFLNKKTGKIILFCTGVLSVMALAAVPTFPERIFILFVITSFTMIADGVFLLVAFVKSKKETLVIPAAIIVTAALIIPSGINFAKISIGYAKNAKINSQNDALLTETSERIKNGEDLSEVHLRKFDETNSEYASTMLYEQPGSWYMGMINTYYGLPYGTELIYE